MDTATGASHGQSVPPGPALNDERTLAALRRYRRRAWLFVVVGIAAFAAACTVLGIHQQNADELLRDGTSTPGVVVGYRYGRYSRITVRYLVDGKMHQGRISTGENVRYELGQTVEVIYDPQRPSRFRTLEEDNASALIITAVAIGFVWTLFSLVFWISALRTARRMRLTLATSTGCHTQNRPI